MHNKNEKKIIDRVLHLEMLDRDFHRLMEQYNMNVTLPLPLHSLNVRRADAKIGIDDTSKEAIEFLNKYYDHDFKYFRHKKISLLSQNQVRCV